MHQVPYQLELVRMGHSVTLCVDQMMLPERAAMGWQPEDTTGLVLHVASDWESKKRIFEESPSYSIHLVSGVRGVNHGGRLTRLGDRLGRRVCWICETWDHRGAKGFIRGLLYQLEVIRYRPCLEKIFAMGDLGVHDYLKIGYYPTQLVPFNYVVKVLPQKKQERPKNSPFVFGFVGSLINLKGVDILLHALANITADKHAWILEIHGDGCELSNLKSLAKELQIENRVFWHGKFPSCEISQRIGRLDALVLPSRKDGWGAVVNEALLCGVPVIVSDACGAACLPARHEWGRVFRAQNVTSCAEACLSVLQNPPTIDSSIVEEEIGPKATAKRILSNLG